MEQVVLENIWDEHFCALHVILILTAKEAGAFAFIRLGCEDQKDGCRDGECGSGQNEMLEKDTPR